MLTQLFKIMWHRKGKNFLLLTEIFFSFMVLFATGALILEGLNNYFSPGGFEYENVYNLQIDRQGESNKESFAKMQQVYQVIRQFPEVDHFSFTESNTPFSFNTMNDDVTAGDKREMSNMYVTEPAYLETLDLELAEGRWFEKTDLGQPATLVINESLQDKLFPGESALGKTISMGEQKKDYKVIGVVKHFRQDGNLSGQENAYFRLYNNKDTASIASNVLLEIKAGVHPAWQQNMIDQLQKLSGNWTIEVTPLSEMRQAKSRIMIIPAVALSVVCGFLIFNVALGLFGVLNYNINKRFAEIGIRRALGATAVSVRRQMLGEVLVLATLALSVGVVLALQFPLLGVLNLSTSIYLLSIAVSLLIVYALVAICAWYPSKQAAQIEPALALHYE